MSDHQDPTPYELERAIVAPDLPGEVIVRPTPYEAIESLAADLLIHAHNCVRTFGDFHLCLSGDPAMEPLLLRLLTDPTYRDLPWRRTHLWCFAEQRDTTNGAEYDLIHETVTIHADLPKEQAHSIDTTRGDAAERYERTIRETLAWREKGHDRFDCVLLAPTSVPEDWLVAGEDDSLVHAYANRVACTTKLINASRYTAVIALGEQSLHAVDQTVDGSHPLAGLDPVGGALRWMLDESACPAER